MGRTAINIQDRVFDMKSVYEFEYQTYFGQTGLSRVALLAMYGFLEIV